TCVELSKKRSLINATRNQKRDHIEIKVGNFETIEKDLTEQFDYITLIGVFEYAENYISADKPYDTFLTTIAKHLKPNGKIIIALENKYGLKYFAGCKEDHTGRYYEGLEGYPSSNGVKTFSRNTLEHMFKENGFYSEFYYPYPDYKLPHTIYSDKKLPNVGELSTNMRNFDADRLIVFDEEKVFNQIIQDQMFPHYSNSFLAVVTKEVCAEEQVIYAKCSSERRNEFSICTCIKRMQNGDRRLYKYAYTKAANAHINSIPIKYRQLKELYQRAGLLLNQCEPVSGSDSDECSCISPEYLDGVDLNQYLNELSRQKDYDKILLTIDQYVEKLNLTATKHTFHPTTEFEKIFGTWKLGDDYACVSPCALDLIFSNILLTGNENDRQWNVLDYEWSFEFDIPLKFILYRTLFYYQQDKNALGFLADLMRKKIDLYEHCHISKEEQQQYAAMEHQFQLYIIEGKASFALLHAIMPQASVKLDTLIKGDSFLKELQTPKIYYGTGNGFQGEQQIPALAMADDDNRVTLDLDVLPNMKEIRLDPTEYPCLIKINEIKAITTAEPVLITRFLLNGLAVSETMFVYDTSDAQLIIEQLPEHTVKIHFDYTVSTLREPFYSELVKSLKDQVEASKTTPTLLDKVLIKCKMAEPETIPQGYCYNKESDE
ncbi:MAG: class I SAM-dependent methyltransferase, partial [Clostridia bacterium]|nr:class I SAM-dependent methyltransferase [Clostridia bacterium]